jgi:hypothetical protein
MTVGTRFEGTEEKHLHSTPYCVFCALQVTLSLSLHRSLAPRQTATDALGDGLWCRVVIALQDLFVNYAYSDEFMIPPTDLRRALSAQFAGEARFKIGEMVHSHSSVESVYAMCCVCVHSCVIVDAPLTPLLSLLHNPVRCYGDIGTPSPRQKMMGTCGF